jgi:hypothetical protein
LDEWINEPGWPPGTRTAGDLPAEPFAAVTFEPPAPGPEPLARETEPLVPEPEPVEPEPPELEPPPGPGPPLDPEPPPGTPAPWCEWGEASWRAESSGIEYIAPAGLFAFGSVA